MVLAKPNLLSESKAFQLTLLPVFLVTQSLVTDYLGLLYICVMSNRPSLRVSKEEKQAVILTVLKVEKWRSYFSVFFLKFDQMSSGFLYSPDKTLWGFESAQN